ncbi:MAG: AAA family ATPase, partial [Halobacteriovoraceae bacterium]|nr:AAA family ATPase [Halobacteriovoraceae bacterium]
MKGFFVTGIDTNIGKTLACAILVRAIHGNYWKPVQCGDLENTDTHTVKRLLNDFPCQFYPERFRLKAAQSPHRAAKEENVKIYLNDFSWPESNAPLIVEGAGGVLVPLNSKNYTIDL